MRSFKILNACADLCPEPLDPDKPPPFRIIMCRCCSETRVMLPFGSALKIRKNMKLLLSLLLLFAS